MKVDITTPEKEDLARGMLIRICIVETGDPVMRANDAINCGEHKKVRALSEDQRALIARHEALVVKLQSAR